MGDQRQTSATDGVIVDARSGSDHALSMVKVITGPLTASFRHFDTAIAGLCNALSSSAFMVNICMPALQHIQSRFRPNG